MTYRHLLCWLGALALVLPLLVACTATPRPAVVPEALAAAPATSPQPPDQLVPADSSRLRTVVATPTFVPTALAWDWSGRVPAAPSALPAPNARADTGVPPDPAPRQATPSPVVPPPVPAAGLAPAPTAAPVSEPKPESAGQPPPADDKKNKHDGKKDDEPKKKDNEPKRKDK